MTALRHVRICGWAEEGGFAVNASVQTDSDG